MTVKDPQTGNLDHRAHHQGGSDRPGLHHHPGHRASENETRLLSLNTDDSNEQTSRVMMQLASEAVDDVDLDRWTTCSTGWPTTRPSSG